MKKFAAVVFLAAAMLLLAACRRDINYIVDHEPSVRGIVTETGEEWMEIAIHEDEPLYGQYERVLVSLAVERKDSMTQFDVGDDVAVYYDGAVDEEARIGKVWAILYMGGSPEREADE